MQIIYLFITCQVGINHTGFVQVIHSLVLQNKRLSQFFFCQLAHFVYEGHRLCSHLCAKNNTFSRQYNQAYKLVSCFESRVSIIQQSTHGNLFGGAVATQKCCHGNYGFAKDCAEAFVSFIHSPPEHSSYIFPLVALYLRQDVCHLWQHVIKFRSPLMTPAGAGIAQWWKLLFITRIKSVRFVFLMLSFYSFNSQCHPFKKALCPQIKKRKTILNWWFTNLSESVV